MTGNGERRIIGTAAGGRNPAAGCLKQPDMFCGCVKEILFFFNDCVVIDVGDGGCRRDGKEEEEEKYNKGFSNNNRS